MSHGGYIKRLPVSSYRKQRRGGKGVTGADIKDEDFVEHLFIASTHDYILFFTDKGMVHWLKVYDIPEGARTATRTSPARSTGSAISPSLVTSGPPYAAAKKAFLVNRVGDFGLAVAVFLLWMTYGTLNFSDTMLADGSQLPGILGEEQKSQVGFAAEVDVGV